MASSSKTVDTGRSSSSFADNLAAALTACTAGGWTVLQGQATFDYIKDLSGFDLTAWLKSCKKSGEFFINKA